jgi:hypothetical protein
MYEILESIIPANVSTATLYGTSDTVQMPMEVVEMAGKIQRMIEVIVAERSKGNEMLAKAVKTKLILKGINPALYSDQSEDDPTIIKKLENMLHDLKR